MRMPLRSEPCQQASRPEDVIWWKNDRDPPLPVRGLPQAGFDTVEQPLVPLLDGGLRDRRHGFGAVLFVMQQGWLPAR